MPFSKAPYCDVDLVVERIRAEGEAIFVKSGKVTYLVDGEETDKEEIEGLPEVHFDEDAQGGLNDQVIIRDYKVSSIQKIRIGGVEHE